VVFLVRFQDLAAGSSPLGAQECSGAIGVHPTFVLKDTDRLKSKLPTSHRHRALSPSSRS
jgi:hypothetical protein